MKSITLMLMCFFTIPVFSQTATLVPILQTGPDSNRFNILVVSEGFTSSHMGKLDNAMDTLKKYMFSESPYKEYENFFNLFLLKVACADSGVRHPGTATNVVENPASIYLPNNCFGTSYDYSRIHNMLWIADNAGLYNLIAQYYPSYDRFLVLNNTTAGMYGRAGMGTSAIVNMHNDYWPIVVLHEFGHAIGGLADEYWVDKSPYKRPNRDTIGDPGKVKWKNWVGTNSIGVYQFGNIGNTFHYRPHQECKMQKSTKPYCSVCIEGLIDSLYAKITPIDKVSPSKDTLQSTPAMHFVLQLVYPKPNTLSVEWRLNGSTLPVTDTILNINDAQLQNGNNTLTAYVTDTTSLSRTYRPAAGYQFSCKWEIVKTKTSTLIESPSSASFIYKLYPNPVSDKLYLEYDNKAGDNKFNYALSTIDGKIVKSGHMHLQQNKGSTSIDVEGLIPGTYYLRISNKATYIQSKFIKH